MPRSGYPVERFRVSGASFCYGSGWVFNPHEIADTCTTVRRSESLTVGYSRQYDINVLF
jgi:hypothetical protein